MALTLDQDSRLSDMVDLIDRNRRLLSKWEGEFCYGEDEEWPGVIRAFFDKGADIRITDRMWPILDRIYWKVTH